jgi:hypothetical protein
MATTSSSRSTVSRLALLACAVAIAGSLVVVAIAFLSPPGIDQAPFTAGLIGEFAPGSVTYFEDEHFYLVRTSAGEFRAFYDLDPYQQARSGQVPEARSQCRLVWYDAVSWLRLSGPTLLAGTEAGAFREPCQDVTYTAEGLRVFGPSAYDMDEFPVVLESDFVKVDLTNRICGQRQDGLGQRDCAPIRRP